MGIRRNPTWNNYSYSLCGMPLEDGYDANYGNGGLQLIEVAELTHHPNNWAKGTATNVVRIEYTTPTINRLVTAICVNSPGGALGLNTLRYGPYFLVLNGSEERRFRYEIPEDLRGKAATDLLTGKQANLKSLDFIPPFSSRVFVLSNANK